jgi:hypothetical protein
MQATTTSTCAPAACSRVRSARSALRVLLASSSWRLTASASAARKHASTQARKHSQHARRPTTIQASSPLRAAQRRLRAGCQASGKALRQRSALETDTHRAGMPMSNQARAGCESRARKATLRQALVALERLPATTHAPSAGCCLLAACGRIAPHQDFNSKSRNTEVCVEGASVPATPLFWPTCPLPAWHLTASHRALADARSELGAEALHLLLVCHCART